MALEKEKHLQNKIIHIQPQSNCLKTPLKILKMKFVETILFPQMSSYEKDLSNDDQATHTLTHTHTQIDR